MWSRKNQGGNSLYRLYRSGRYSGKGLFQVGVDFAFVIAQHVFALGLGNDIIRAYWNLSASAGCVYYIGRHAVTGGVAAHLLYNIDAYADRRAEMLSASYKVALIDIIGPDH